MATKPDTLDDTIQADTSDEAVSHQVVRAVANAKGVDPLDLPPLYDSIDADAIDALFSNADADTSISKLQFQVAGCEVLVRGDGEVTVTHTEDDLDTIDGESQPDSDSARDSIEDRCGVSLGKKGRRDTDEN